MQIKRLIILLVIIALAIVVSFLDPVQGIVNHILETSKQFMHNHQVLGLALFVLLSAVSGIVFFFSTTLIVPVAVYAWGKPMTIVLLWGSWLLGAAGSYWIGRHPGRRVAKWIVPGKRVARYEKRITANATFPLILLFQLAVPSEIPGYLLGTLRYRFGKYMGARALAEIPFAVGTVFLGSSYLQRQYVLLSALAVGGVIFSAAALYFLNKRIGSAANR